jgi:hypothetical protein
MMKKYWIKLYIDILDNAKMGRLDNHLWRRAVECYLLAGQQGDDGALRPVEEMAWKLRLPIDKLLEDLHCLAEVGVVHEGEPGKWVVTNFKERQNCESLERVRRYRERYRNGNSNGEVAEGISTSTSDSVSFSDSVKGEGFQREGEAPQSHDCGVANGGSTPPSRRAGIPVMEKTPETPAEAMRDEDILVFQQATGGQIPGLAQYGVVIDSVRLLREREKLADEALVKYLMPYWLAWRSRRRKDGREYDQGNITWLTEWAVNGTIPSNQAEGKATDNAEIIRQAARNMR